MIGTIEGVVFLVLGGALIAGVAKVVRIGRMRDRRFVIDRVAQPVTFWFMIAYFGLVGIALAVLGLFYLTVR